MKPERLPQTILILDLVWIGFSVAAGGGAWRDAWAAIAPTVIAGALWCWLFFSARLDGIQNPWNWTTRILQAASGALVLALLLGAIAWLDPDVAGFSAFRASGLLVAGIAAIRLGERGWLRRRYRNGGRRRLVLIGHDQLVQECLRNLSDDADSPDQVVGMLVPAGSGAGLVDRPAPAAASANMGSLDVPGYLAQKNVDALVVLFDECSGAEWQQLLEQCRQEGIETLLLPHHYSLYLSTPRLRQVAGLPMLSAEPAGPSLAGQAGKRALDLCVAPILGLLALPLLFLGILVAGWKQRTWPLVRGTLCGRGGKQFPSWRLKIQAEDRGRSRWLDLLASTGISEIPQFLNVLRGQMSLVGPRPDGPGPVDRYTAWERQRLQMRPGLTGLAQVQGVQFRHSAAAKARYDLKYQTDWNLLLDVALLLQSPWVLLRRALRRATPGGEPLAAVTPGVAPTPAGSVGGQPF